MDAISLLSGLKDKVLDAKNFDLLKHTYDLQNQNIEQLKTSNDFFKEDNKRLREEVNVLKTENESLKQTVTELTERVSQLNGGSASSGLSKVAFAVLGLYQQLDETHLYREAVIVPTLNFSKIQIESAIDELMNADLIICGSSNPRQGLRCSLTVEGKKYLTENM
jgi:cell division protein FtsB